MEKDRKPHTTRPKQKTTYLCSDNSEEIRRKRETLLRQYVRDFDLEGTKTKYRNSNVFEYRPKGKSLADFRFRSELIRMMGTEVIRLSDQSWSQRFQEKLREDYEARLDQQEQLLAAEEKKRMHRLRVEGIITDSPDDEDVKKSMERSISHIPDSFTKDISHYEKLRQTMGKPLFAEEDLNRRERGLRERMQRRLYRPPPELPPFDYLLTDEPNIQPKTSEFIVSHTESMIRAEIDRARQLDARKKKRYKHLPYDVVRLYEEETVSGLYALGERLLPPRPESHQEECSNA